MRKELSEEALDFIKLWVNIFSNQDLCNVFNKAINKSKQYEDQIECIGVSDYNIEELKEMDCYDE